MTDAVIHIDKIIEHLPTPDCCGMFAEALMCLIYLEENRGIKDRPNGFSCWYCNGCGSTWSPMIDNEKIIFVHYDAFEDEFHYIDIVNQGFVWRVEE